MTRILCLLPVVAMVALGTSAPNAARKCGTQLPGAKAFVAIDGVFLPPGAESPMSTIPSDDILAVHIYCMNPADSTYHPTHGVAVMSIWTRKGPLPRVAEALDVIRQAQDASFARNGRYITSLGEVQFAESMKPVRLALEADGKGWIARATLPRLPRTCVMFDGIVANPPAGTPRKSVCEDDNKPDPAASRIRVRVPPAS